jgi:hypothetical protein
MVKATLTPLSEFFPIRQEERPEARGSIAACEMCRRAVSMHAAHARARVYGMDMLKAANLPIPRPRNPAIFPE